MNPPDGERYVRVIRSTQAPSTPVCHPTNPNMDSWIDGAISTRLVWARVSEIKPSDILLDL